MVIKASNKGHKSVSMNLNVDWELKEISIEVSFYNDKGGFVRCLFPANDFSSAMKRFDEFNEMLESEQHWLYGDKDE